ncbi:MULTISPECIES: helix-turn-helix domain-containing protein [Halomonas]|uniref:helix-turn-helix domain-containing protein n=1 Tax=Halomonas TaxID=2745 RepID=UPI001C953C81|nr:MULTISPECIES: helix-turn-helix domain-containing protein [Halomonas]MBY6209183.1 helix-turn-helix domain-containing protein [Halomonas sp. DP3Y7-2]MBY6229339.1 helix-turn-helix domain-containing protein [Halomonas sp. DP3Y7-1]MCA0917598.1 helix-turn-helix domain-containing protein [Halomonas denitrificans]
MAQDRVEAVERALSVLNVFDTPQESFSLAELAEATGYYKSTLLRLLASLERFDYTQRGSDGRWRIGSAPVRLARRHAPSRELAAQVQPWLDELSLELGETASLLEMIDGIVQCRLAARPDHSLRHDLLPGHQWPAPSPSDPCAEMPGGIMVCRPLELADQPAMWLAVSGPNGRVNEDQATLRLDQAVKALTAGHDHDGRH